MTNRLLPALLLLGFLQTALPAHDLYLLPEKFHVAAKTKLRIGFHNGDAFPDSEAAPVIARLKDAQLRSASGTLPILNLAVNGKRAVGDVLIPDGDSDMMLSVHTVPNFIQLTPDKFLDYLKEEGLQHVIDWRAKHGESSKPSRERYSKFAKSLIAAGDSDSSYSRTVGFDIEIIPDANPYKLHPGADLPVRVLVHGKPAAGLQLEAAWAVGGKSKTTVVGLTDAQGRIHVPLTVAGIWRLHSVSMERCAEPTVADWESLWASLTFEVR